MGQCWENTCPYCGVPKCYSERYDALYCASCDVWLEDACDDPECEFCPDRPEKPSQADSLNFSFEELMDGLSWVYLSKKE